MASYRDSIPNRIGTGTIWFRADYELVGRVCAAKLRQRSEPLPAGESLGHLPAALVRRP